jgi:hypothetical protein
MTQAQETVHESGELGVALIGVASAGISGADVGPATSTLLAVVPNCSRMGGTGEMNVGIQQRKLAVSR